MHCLLITLTLLLVISCYAKKEKKIIIKKKKKKKNSLLKLCIQLCVCTVTGIMLHTMPVCSILYIPCIFNYYNIILII